MCNSVNAALESNATRSISSGLVNRLGRSSEHQGSSRPSDGFRCRAHPRHRGIIGWIARRGIDSSERLGKHRWVAEKTHSWFADFGKLRIRFERRLDIHEALLKLAAAIICARFVDW